MAFKGAVVYLLLLAVWGEAKPRPQMSATTPLVAPTSNLASFPGGAQTFFSGGGGGSSGRSFSFTSRTDANGRTYMVDQNGNEVDPSQLAGFQSGGGGGSAGRAVYTYRTDKNGRRYLADSNGNEVDPSLANQGTSTITRLVYTWRTDSFGRRYLSDQNGNEVNPASLNFKVPDPVRTIRYIYIVNKVTGRRYLVDESGKEVDASKIQTGKDVNIVITDEAGNKVDSKNLIITRPTEVKTIRYIYIVNKITGRRYLIDESGNEVDATKLPSGPNIKLLITDEAGNKVDTANLIITRPTEVKTIRYIYIVNKTTGRRYLIDESGNEVDPTKLPSGPNIKLLITDEVGNKVDTANLIITRPTDVTTIHYIYIVNKVTGRRYLVDETGKEVDATTLPSGPNIRLLITDEAGNKVDTANLIITRPDNPNIKTIRYIYIINKITGRRYLVDETGKEADPSKFPNGPNIRIVITDEKGNKVDNANLILSPYQFGGGDVEIPDVNSEVITYILRTDKTTNRIYFVDQLGNEVEPSKIRFPQPTQPGRSIVIKIINESGKPVDPSTIKWNEIVTTRTITYILRTDRVTNRIYFVDQNGNEIDPSRLRDPKPSPNGQHVVITYTDEFGNPIEPSTIKWTEVVPSKVITYILKRDIPTNRIYFVDQLGNEVDPLTIRFPKEDPTGKHIIITYTDEKGQPVEPSTIEWSKIVPSKTIIYILRREPTTNRIYFVDQNGNEVDPTQVRFPQPDPSGKHVVVTYIDETGTPVEPSTIKWTEVVPTKRIIYILKREPTTNRIYFVDQNGNEVDPSKFRFPPPSPNGQHIVITYIDDSGKTVEPTVIDWTQVVPSETVIYILRREPTTNRIYFVDQNGKEVDPSTVRNPKPDPTGKHIYITFIDETGTPVEPSTIDWNNLVPYKTFTYILKNDPPTNKIYFVDQVGKVIDPQKIQFPQSEPSGEHIIIKIIDYAGKTVEPSTIDWSQVYPSKTVIYILKTDEITKRIYFVDQQGNEVDPTKIQFPQPKPGDQHVIVTIIDQTGTPVEPSTIDWSNLVPTKTVTYIIKIDQPTNRIFFVDQHGNPVDPSKIKFPKPDPTGQHIIITYVDDSGKPVEPSTIDWSNIVQPKTIIYILRREPITNRIYFVDQNGKEVDPSIVQNPKQDPGQYVIITVIDETGKPVEPSTIDWTKVVPSKTIVYILKRDPVTTRIYFVDQHGYEVDPKHIQFPKPDPSGQHITITIVDETDAPVEPSTIDWSKLVPSRNIIYIIKRDPVTQQIFFVDQEGNPVDPSRVQFPKPDPNGNHIIITFEDDSGKAVEPSKIEWTNQIPSKTIIYVYKTDKITNRIYFVDEFGNEVDPSELKHPKHDPNGQLIIINFRDEEGKPVEPSVVNWENVVPSKVITIIVKTEPDTNRIYFVDLNGKEVDPSKIRFPEPAPNGQHIIVKFIDDSDKPIKPSVIDWTNIVTIKNIVYIMKTDKTTNQIYFVDQSGYEVDPQKIQFPKPDSNGQQIIGTIVDETGTPVDPSTIDWTRIVPFKTVVYILRTDEPTKQIYFVDQFGNEVDPLKLQFPKPDPSGQHIIITFTDDSGEPVEPSTINWTQVVPSKTIVYIIKTDPLTNRVYFVDPLGYEVDPATVQFPKREPNQHTIITFVDETEKPVEPSTIDWTKVVPVETIIYTLRTDDVTNNIYFVDQFGNEVDPTSLRFPKPDPSGQHIVFIFKDDTGTPVEPAVIDWNNIDPSKTITYIIKTDDVTSKIYFVDPSGNEVDPSTIRFPKPDPNGQHVIVIFIDDTGKPVAPSVVDWNNLVPSRIITYIIKTEEPTNKIYFVDPLGNEVDPSVVRFPKPEPNEHIIIVFTDESGNPVQPSQIDWTNVVPSKTITYILKVDEPTNQIFFVDPLGYEVDPSTIHFPKHDPNGQHIIFTFVDEEGKPVEPSSINWDKVVPSTTVTYILKMDKVTQLIYFVDQHGIEVEPSNLRFPKPNENGQHIIIKFIDEDDKQVEPSTIDWTKLAPSKTVIYILKEDKVTNHIYFVDQFGNEVDPAKFRFPEPDPSGQRVIIKIIDETEKPIDHTVIDWKNVAPAKTIIYILKTDPVTNHIYFVDQNGNEIDPSTIKNPKLDPSGQHIIITYIDDSGKPIEPSKIEWTNLVPSKTIIYIVRTDDVTKRIYFVDQNGNEVDPSTIQNPKPDPNGQHIIITYIDDTGKPVQPSVIDWTNVVPSKVITIIVKTDPDSNRIYFVDPHGKEIDPSKLRFPEPDPNGHHIIITYVDENEKPIIPTVIDWTNVVPVKHVVYIIKVDKPTNKIYFVDQLGYEVDPQKLEFPKPDPSGQHIIITFVDESGKTVEPSTINWSNVVPSKTVTYIIKVDKPTNQIFFVDQFGNEIDPLKLQFPKPDPSGQHIIIIIKDEYDQPVEPSTIDWTQVYPSKTVVYIIKTDPVTHRIYFVDPHGYEVDPNNLQFPKRDPNQHIIITYVDETEKPVEPSTIDWTKVVPVETIIYTLKTDDVTNHIYFVDQFGNEVDPSNLRFPKHDPSGQHIVIVFTDDSGKPVEPSVIDWNNLVPSHTITYIIKTDDVTNKIYFVDQFGNEVDPSKIRFPQPDPNGQHIIITFTDETGKPLKPTVIDWTNIAPTRIITYVIKTEQPSNKIYFVDQLGNEIDPSVVRFPKPQPNEHLIITFTDEFGKPVEHSTIDWTRLVPSKTITYILKIDQAAGKIFFVDPLGYEVDPSTIRFPKRDPNGQHIIITYVDEGGKPVEPATINWETVVPSKTVIYIMRKDPLSNLIYFVDQNGNEVDPSKVRFPKPDPNGQHIIIKFIDETGTPVEPSTVDWTRLVPSKTVIYILKVDKTTNQIYFVDQFGNEVDPSKLRFPQPDPAGQHIIITFVDETEKPVEPSTIDWTNVVPSKTIIYILRTDPNTQLIYFVDQNGNEVDPSKLRFPQPDPSGQHIIITIIDETGTPVQPSVIDWSKLVPTKTIVYILKTDKVTNYIYFVDQEGNQVDPSTIQFPKPDPSGQHIIITFVDETGKPVEPTTIDWTKIAPSVNVIYILRNDPITHRIYFVDQNGNEVDPSVVRFPKPDPNGQRIVITIIDETGQPIDPSTIKWTDIVPSITVVYILKKDPTTGRIYFVDQNGNEMDPSKLQFPQPDPSGQHIVITFVDESGKPIDASTINWTEIVQSKTIVYILKTDPITHRIYFVDQKGNEVDPTKIRFPKHDPNGVHFIITIVDESGKPVEPTVIDWTNVVTAEIITYIVMIDQVTGQQYFVDQFGNRVDPSKIHFNQPNEPGQHIVINFVDQTGNQVDSTSISWLFEIDIYTVTYTIKTHPNGGKYLVDVLGNIVNLNNFQVPKHGPNGEPVTLILLDEAGNHVDPSTVIINGRLVFGGSDVQIPGANVIYILRIDQFTGRHYFVDINGLEVDPSKVRSPQTDQNGNQITITIIDEQGQTVNPSTIIWTQFQQQQQPSKQVVYILRTDPITHRIYFVDHNGYEVDPTRIHFPKPDANGGLITVTIIDEAGNPRDLSTIQWDNVVQYTIVTYIFKTDHSTGRQYFVDQSGNEVNPQTVLVPHPNQNGVHVIGNIVDEFGNYVDLSLIQFSGGSSSSAFLVTFTVRTDGNGGQYLTDSIGNRVDLSQLQLPSSGPNGEPIVISLVDESGNAIDASSVHIQGLSGGSNGMAWQFGGNGGGNGFQFDFGHQNGYPNGGGSYTIEYGNGGNNQFGNGGGSQTFQYGNGNGGNSQVFQYGNGNGGGSQVFQYGNGNGGGSQVFYGNGNGGGSQVFEYGNGGGSQVFQYGQGSPYGQQTTILGSRGPKAVSSATA